MEARLVLVELLLRQINDRLGLIVFGIVWLVVLEEVPICSCEILLRLLGSIFGDVSFRNDQESRQQEYGVFPSELLFVIREDSEYHLIGFLGRMGSTLVSFSSIFRLASMTISLSFFF